MQGEDGMLNGCHVGNEMDTRVMEWRTCNTSRANCPGMADVLPDVWRIDKKMSRRWRYYAENVREMTHHHKSVGVRSPDKC